MKVCYPAAALGAFLLTPALAEPPADADKAPATEERAVPVVETIAPPPPVPGKSRAAGTPEFKLSLSDDKKVVHLMGSFASGISGELKLLLQKNPAIETIVLSSQGGSMIDGFAVEKIIRQHGLNTHVELFCASACTEAFWGGKNRTIARNARLGYHQATRGLFAMPFAMGDESQSPANQLWQKLYQERGISEGFIQKAISTLGRDIWLPSQDELLAENISTRIVTDSKPGIASNGSWLNAAVMEKELFAGPYWDFLRSNQPKIYYHAAHQAWVGWQFSKEDKSSAELAENGTVGMILKNADKIPDALLLRFIAAEQAIWETRNDVLNKSCRTGGFAGPAFPIAFSANAAILDQRRSLLFEMAKTLDGEMTVDAARSGKAQASLIEYWAEMVVRGDYDSDNVGRNFCTEPVNYYDILLKLPEQKRLEYFRALVVTLLHPMPMPMPITAPTPTPDLTKRSGS